MHNLKVKTNGTFGELAQGYIYDEKINAYHHFLFTLPIKEVYSEASLSYSKEVVGFPLDKCKSQQAFTILQKKFNIKISPDISIKINSNIPVEKGYASSTADIVSVCKLFFVVSGLNLNQQQINAEIIEVLKVIEWSDYLLYEGISCYYQREHQLISTYPTNLGLKILGIEEDYKVNTEEFHNTYGENRDKAAKYSLILNKMHRALKNNDYFQIGKLATESSLLNNDVLPKINMQRIMSHLDESSALGICVAHSGSLIGLLFSKLQPNFIQNWELAKNKLVKENICFKEYSVIEFD